MVSEVKCGIEKWGLYGRWLGATLPKIRMFNHVLSLEYCMKSVSKYSTSMPSVKHTFIHGAKLHVYKPTSSYTTSLDCIYTQHSNIYWNM